MAALSRAIKQELLEDLKPEIYVAPRRKSRVKAEEKLDVKTLVKSRSKKRRAAKAELEEDVEFVRKFAPRRPYQWKGRKVQAVLRPGVPVVFTPGQRSGRAVKRDYDEVYADEDVLDQAGAMINEFAYGKRAKLLTERNPTPSQVPVTPQEPVVRPGEARLLPTVQVLMPKNIKREVELPVGKSEGGDVKIENKGIEQVGPGLAVQTVDIKVPIKRKRGEEPVSVKRLKEEIEEMDDSLPPMKETVKMEYSEEPVVAGRPIAVARKRRPVQVLNEAPAPPAVEIMEVQQSPPSVPVVVETPRRVLPGKTGPLHRWGPANAIFPDYRYHPSITARKIRGPVPVGRVSRWGPANSIIPEVRLHPSMVGAVVRPARRRRARARARPRRRTRRGVIIPEVRYHPSITLLNRRA